MKRQKAEQEGTLSQCLEAEIGYSWTLIVIFTKLIIGCRDKQGWYVINQCFEN